MSLGQKVKKTRISRVLSQKELAERAGISQSSLHYIENDTNNPTVRTLKKIASALSVSMDELTHS